MFIFTWICNKVISDSFYKVKKSLTIWTRSIIMMILNRPSVFLEKRLNHLLLENGSYWVFYWLKNNFFRSIRCDTGFINLPILPLKFCTDDVLLSLLQIRLNGDKIWVFILNRINKFPTIPSFHYYYPCRRVFVIVFIDFHASFVFLIQRNRVFSTLWHFHFDIAWFMILKIHRQTCMNEEWVDFTYGKFIKIN